MALNFRKADRLRKFFNGCEITIETFERELCVRGYHVYQRIWTAAVGEALHCEREPTNSRDRYAVAVKIFRALASPRFRVSDPQISAWSSKNQAQGVQWIPAFLWRNARRR